MVDSVAVKKLTVDELRSLRQVTNLMLMLRMPKISDDALMAVSKEEGVKFKQALVSMHNGDALADQSKKYVWDVCCLLIAGAQASIMDIGLPLPSYETLIRAGIKHGKKIREALATAAESKGQGNAELVQWIKEAFNGQNPAEPTAQKNAPPKAMVPPSNENQSERYSTSPEATVPSDRKFYSIHFYGGKAALCFKPSETRTDKIPTVSFDAATLTAPKTYDWKDSVVHFQFTPMETIRLAGVLCGAKESEKFDAHGENHDKFFEIKRQPDVFFCVCNAKGKPSKPVPIQRHEAVLLLSLVVDQIAKAHNMKHEMVIPMIMATLRPLPLAA